MKKRTGFTLMELLVVIAIIALVIAILLPVLKRAWRPAQVLASPIAYLNFTEKRLYVTDARGQGQLELYTAKDDYPQGQVEWSPSGQRIAFRTVRVDSKSIAVSQEVVVVNPFTGQYRALTGITKLSESWIGWVDNTHIAVTTDSRGLRIVNVESGLVVREIRPSGSRSGAGVFYDFDAFTPFPQGKQYMGVGSCWTSGRRQGSVLAVLRSDLSPGKTVWDSGSAPWKTTYFGKPRVDPSGEWVAWEASANDGKNWNGFIAMKPVQEPSSRLPTLLSTTEVIAGGVATLCDWTEDGNLLLSVYHQAEHVTRLAVIDRTGKLLRVLPIMDIGPDLGAAAWRKYYHQ